MKPECNAIVEPKETSPSAGFEHWISCKLKRTQIFLTNTKYFSRLAMKSSDILKTVRTQGERTRLYDKHKGLVTRKQMIAVTSHLADFAIAVGAVLDGS
jgi:hypothetical protein